MSDRVERAVEAVNDGKTVTRVVNSEMTREEQVQFARRLWENGGTATASGVPGVYTKPVGDAEVTFRTVNGERQVADIVFRGRDIYDTPDDARGRQAAAARNNRTASTNRGIGSDDRYSTAPVTPESAQAERTRLDYERCLETSGNRASRNERAICADSVGHTVPGDNRKPVQERSPIATKSDAAKSMSFNLPQLELV